MKIDDDTLFELNNDMKFKVPNNETLMYSTKDIKSLTDNSLKRFLQIDSSIKNNTSSNNPLWYSSIDTSSNRKKMQSYDAKNFYEAKYFNPNSPTTNERKQIGFKNSDEDIQCNLKNFIQKIKINTNKNSKADIMYSIDNKQNSSKNQFFDRNVAMFNKNNMSPDFSDSNRIMLQDYIGRINLKQEN